MGIVGVGVGRTAYMGSDGQCDREARRQIQINRTTAATKRSAASDERAAGADRGECGRAKIRQGSMFAAAFEAEFRRTARTLTALVGRPDNRQTLAYAPRST